MISNHQAEIDMMDAMATFILRGGYRTPVLTASAKVMYEPGFLAQRAQWMWRLLYNVNLGWMFFSMGLLPLENELQSRSIARWAWGVQRRHGDLPLDQVFKPAVIARYGWDGMTTRDLFKMEHFKSARDSYVRLSELLPLYRREEFDDMRAGVDADLARIEQAMLRGATFYVTPEGEYSPDGVMLPFRGIWERLSPNAQNIYLTAISYDPLAGKRLSQLYRIVPLVNRENVVAELKAARPVTTSALLSEWLAQRDDTPFTDEEAVAAVEERLRTLPAGLFVDPELKRSPRTLVLNAVRNLRARGRRHPQFPKTDDIVAFQARFFAETLQGLEQVHLAELPVCPNGAGLPA